MNDDQIKRWELNMEDLSQDELLPCPLCGDKPDLVDFAGWEILCKCGISLVMESAAKEPLVKHWNTRTQSNQ